MRRILFFLAAAAWALWLPAKELLEIKGDFLLYSYDFNYIYGQGNIQIKSKHWTIQAGVVEIDIAGRAALASRGCRVQSGGSEYSADLLEIDLESLGVQLATFKEQVRSWTLPGSREPAADKNAAVKKVARQDYEALKRSLVYFLNKRIVITTLYRVYGYQSTAFIEGAQSLSFKRFNLDRGGETTHLQGVYLDRLWYYASQGLVLNSHFLMEKAFKRGAARSANALDVKYDPFQQIDFGPALRVNFNSQNSLSLARNHEAGVNISYLTDNLFQARLAFKSRWSPRLDSEVAAEYSRTAARREELWLSFRSGLQDKRLGTAALHLGYEREKQYRAELSLQNQALKNVRLSLQVSRSRLLFDENRYNRQDSSNFTLSYTHRLFQMAADYSFHRDLLQDRSQGTPRFTLNATPFRLYHGLLKVNFVSSFMVNQLNLGGQRDDQSRANLAIDLQSETIRLGRGPAFTFSLASEQLLDPERANRFTSLGGIFKCSQDLAGIADLDIMYNYNTRRQTEAWLIQGSTSQDWSAVLRLKPGPERLQGWASVSYDSKGGNFTNGYLDCSVKLVKNWQLQAQLNYDFMFRNFNYDAYLVRSAGRIMLRASYRSLSRRFLLEVLPL